MTNTAALNLMSHGLVLIAEIAGPVLAISLIVGLVISVFQAVTSIQEFTLTFLPKVAAIALVLVFLGHWMLGDLVTYTQHLYNSIPQVIAGQG